MRTSLIVAPRTVFCNSGPDGSVRTLHAAAAAAFLERRCGTSIDSQTSVLTGRYTAAVKLLLLLCSKGSSSTRGYGFAPLCTAQLGCLLCSREALDSVTANLDRAGLMTVRMTGAEPLAMRCSSARNAR